MSAYLVDRPSTFGEDRRFRLFGVEGGAVQGQQAKTTARAMRAESSAAVTVLSKS